MKSEVSSLGFTTELTDSRDGDGKQPHTSTCFSCHESKLTLRTKDMCTPSARWIPEQSMHINTPKLALAHLGPRFWQSTHLSLPPCLRSFSSRLRSFTWSAIAARGVYHTFRLQILRCLRFVQEIISRYHIFCVEWRVESTQWWF